MARTYHVSAPARVAVQGAPVELGYQPARKGYGIGGGGVGGPLEDASAAWTQILGDFVGIGQVVLGLAVLGIGVLVVVSQTSAGAAVGGAAAKTAAGGVRRGLRLIPGVGAIV